MKFRGFTLIELLVVIAIIGLLATVSAVSFSTSREKARIAKGTGFEGQVLRGVGDDIVARWDFDECSGSTFSDFSGYGHGGSLVSGVTFSTNTPTGNGCSLRFDGTGRIVIPNVSLSLQQTKTFWVYLTGAVTGNQYLIDEGANQSSVQVYISKFYVGDWSYAWFPSTMTPVTGKWYFLAVIYDGSNMSIYVDGALDKKQAVTPVVPPGPVTLGDYGGGGYRLTGNLDNVRIYNRPLTSMEVRQLYVSEVSKRFAFQSLRDQ